MARPAQDVTNAELAVLQVLWDHGPLHRRRLTEILYPRGGPSYYTTVQKLLERLEAKGHVAADRTQELVTFRAAITREELINRRLRDVADKLCEGSLTPLVTNLIRTNQLTAKEVEELRKLLDGLKPPGKTSSKRH